MYFLGISSYYHDASVALLNADGKLIDFKKEEWLSRVKGDKSFPRLSLQEIITSYNLSEENLLSVTFYEKPVRAWITVLKHSIKNNPISNDLTRNYFKRAWNSSMRAQMDISKYLNVSKIPLYYSDHHLSHTLSSIFYYSKTPCVSVVVDGYGDKSCTSIHHVKSKKEIINMWTSDYPDSLGLFYSAITDFLGFAVNEGEYKMMGLASFGKPEYYDQLKKTITFKEDKLKIDTIYYDFVRRTDRSYSKKIAEILKIEPRVSNLPLEIGTSTFEKYANIACSAQKILEEILFKIFDLAYRLTNERTFLFSGGVAMNSSAVMKSSKLSFIDELNIPPSPGDSGAALGAAFFGFLKSDKEFKETSLNENLFPGKSNSDENFFEIPFEKISSEIKSLDDTSELIYKNEIIATCYGNIETGPRALGHRSLICNAHNSELIKKLSTEIKKRSLFRPTAPVILKEKAEEYFILEKSLMNNYFHMGAVAIPKLERSQEIKGVIHVDNTSRVQICTEDQLLGKLLKRLKGQNINLLANTSFNISSDPMVYDKEDAYLAVERMGIKYLLTEKGLYKKK